MCTATYRYDTMRQSIPEARSMRQTMMDSFLRSSLNDYAK
jgi:hypothetical protein